MRESFDKQLNQLNKLLLNMAMLVEQIIAMSVKSLQEQNFELAEETIEFDVKINEIEQDIEKLCLKLLLRYQPVFADDLRRVSTALKMITDMERIGDQAADIAEINLGLIQQNNTWELSEIMKMAASATAMVGDSINAYVDQDVDLAQSVVKADDYVDDLFQQVKIRVVEQISKDKSLGEKGIETVMIAKYFERICDHAVNVAQWVVFSITGVHKKRKIM